MIASFGTPLTPFYSCIPVCQHAAGNVATRRARSLTPPPGPAYGANAVGSQLPWR